MTGPIAVVGAGAWGTTLAIHLARTGGHVLLWSHGRARGQDLTTQRVNERYLPGVPFPDGLQVVTDDAALAEATRLWVVAVPSEHLRATVRQLADRLRPSVPVLSVVKGIEEGTHLRMSEVVRQELPGRPVAALSGPNLAREVAAGKPAASVVASEDAELATELASVLSSDRFRVYTNADVVGVELGGALKNVVALAAGMVDGLAFGDSAKAGIITRGLAEITRLGVAAGANPLTFAGLAGVGDLVATCMSPLSRNRRAGELIAGGVPWPEAEERLSGVAEGVATVTGALELASSHGVELPIAEQVRAVIFEGRPPMEAVAALMSRAPKDELGGLEPG
ncbi:MAG TPA: NAD(P)H-dependent glycerol-3-phosphate dehydrogenase [Candidatus Limnocylindria bacterium]|nr:NAD(P)H-dependent glycerol-3-phosphate dehydrogenase [Candidatus Limnocylindria bacterium]